MEMIRATSAFRPMIVLALMASLGPVVLAQNIAGRWAARGRILDDGEQDRSILELTQNGSQLKGKLTGLGYSIDVNGTISGSHFQLFDGDPKNPLVDGAMANQELIWTQWNNSFVARPATLADDFPKVLYLAPPALHKISSNGLANTPPMGWNSWNLFADKVDDKTVRAIADAMVSSGMRDAGYIYVNIDDTWEGPRDAGGNLTTNYKFPDMKALAEYLHSKGLKIGIYSSPGPRTCAGYPGSYGHEEQDAKMFAAWGIDYLKYDWCSAGIIYKGEYLRPVYQRMGDALAASGRQIVFSLCEYGMGNVEQWGAEVGGNLWRSTGDISDSWQSMIGNIESQVHAAPFAGSGHWNDPDMLEVGNGHMTDDEYRTHMTLWAMSAAPLLAGNDIRNMTATTRSILTNADVIAIDQDRLGKQATPVRGGEVERWMKSLADGSVAVAVVNLGANATEVTVDARDLPFAGARMHARDVWGRKNVKFNRGRYAATVPSHGVLLLRVSAS